MQFLELFYRKNYLTKNIFKKTTATFTYSSENSKLKNTHSCMMFKNKKINIHIHKDMQKDVKICSHEFWKNKGQ